MPTKGNQLKGYQRQAHNIGRLIGEGCACKSQLESSFSFDFWQLDLFGKSYSKANSVTFESISVSKITFISSGRNKKTTSHSGAGKSIAFKTVRIRTDRTVTDEPISVPSPFFHFIRKVPSFVTRL
jgi:hypothetical protein